MRAYVHAVRVPPSASWTLSVRCPGLASKCGFLRSMYSARARKDVADGSAHKNLAHGRYDLAKSPTFPTTSACGVQATNTHPGGQPPVPTASVPPPVSPWPGPTRWKPPVTALSAPGVVAALPRWGPTGTLPTTPTRKSPRAPHTTLVAAGRCAPQPDGRLQVARGRDGGVDGTARLCGAAGRLQTRHTGPLGTGQQLDGALNGAVGAVLAALVRAVRIFRAGQAHRRHRRLRLDVAAPPRPRSVECRPVGRLAPFKEQQAAAGQRAGLARGKSGSAFATVRAAYQSSSGLRRMCCSLGRC